MTANFVIILMEVGSTNRHFRVDGKWFLLTWPQSEDLSIYEILRALKKIQQVEYVCVCREDHQETDGKHHHAVIMYARRLRRSFNCFYIGDYACNVRKIKPGWENLKRAIEYVQKDGEFEEEGQFPEKVSKQNSKKEKLIYAATHNELECLQTGLFSMNEIIKLKAFKSCLYNIPPAFKKRKVFWLWGPTGGGKTREAFEVLTEKYNHDIWISYGDLNVFFNGYCGQKGVILDDMRPGMIKFNFLLRILDGYPVVINVKGSHCMWMAETIFITAPTTPNMMYVNKETGQEWDNLDQLLRRIDRIERFPREEEDTQILWFSDDDMSDEV